MSDGPDLTLTDPVPPAIAGEGVDPDDLDALDLDQDLDVAQPPGDVSEEQVRTLLAIPEGVLATVLADPDVPDHWRFSDRELDELVPPLARIINKRPQLQAAVHRGDEAYVAIVLFGYAGRNVAAAQRARRERARVDDVFAETEGAEGGVRPDARFMAGGSTPPDPADRGGPTPAD